MVDVCVEGCEGGEEQVGVAVDEADVNACYQDDWGEHEHFEGADDGLGEVGAGDGFVGVAVVELGAVEGFP